LEAEIDNLVDKLTSLRGVYVSPLIFSRRYLNLSPPWYNGKLLFCFLLSKRTQESFTLFSRFGKGDTCTGTV
jgi:hypothetical protein